jgi:very-short-patch-repair endonuclease
VSPDTATPNPESHFQNFLAERLRKYCFEVKRHIGCSDYRIDLAVVDPAAPDRFVLGIECDGPAYRNAATARDRDKLRQSVLEGLGWKLLRLWSTDWWLDPANEMKKFRQTMAAIKPIPPPR